MPRNRSTTRSTAWQGAPSLLRFAESHQAKDSTDALALLDGADGLEAAVLDTLVKALDSRGSLDVLRHGFKFFGKKIECAYFKPAHGMNPDILAKYARTGWSSRGR